VSFCTLYNPIFYHDSYVFSGIIVDCPLEAESYFYFFVLSEMITYENVRPSLSFEHCFIIILYLSLSSAWMEAKCSRNFHGKV
jgi:hypothetical protein